MTAGATVHSTYYHKCHLLSRSFPLLPLELKKKKRVCPSQAPVWSTQMYGFYSILQGKIPPVQLRVHTTLSIIVVGRHTVIEYFREGERATCTIHQPVRLQKCSLKRTDYPAQSKPQLACHFASLTILHLRTNDALPNFI